MSAPKGRCVGVFTGKRFGFHSNQENDGGGGASDFADANHVGASPLTPIPSRQAWTLRATLSSQAVLNLWWKTSLSYLSLRYTSTPLGSFHGMVLVCAGKHGEEGYPSKISRGFHVRRRKTYNRS